MLVAVLLTASTVRCRVVPSSWPSALDDYQDHPEQQDDEETFQKEDRELIPEEPKSSQYNFKLQEPEEPVYRFDPVDYAPAGRGAVARDVQGSSSSNSGYFDSYQPKTIVLHDDNSFETRFPFPAFPK